MIMLAICLAAIYGMAIGIIIGFVTGRCSL